MLQEAVKLPTQHTPYTVAKAKQGKRTKHNHLETTYNNVAKYISCPARQAADSLPGNRTAS